MARGIVVQVSRSAGGVPKFPVAGPVMLTASGVEGDIQRNVVLHGGPGKAVLMISAAVLADLAAAGFPVYPGALGENLTVRGLDPRLWRAGQRWRVGGAVIELTTLREPCANLFRYGRYIGEELYDAQCRAGNTASPRWAGGGFYARVLEEGFISAGAEIEVISDQA